MIEYLLLNGYEQYISDAFYDICKKDMQSEYIKSLLSNESFKQKFSRNVLNSGIVAALENNNDEYIKIIFKHIEENNIKNQLYTIINPLLKAIDLNHEKTVIAILKHMDKNPPDSDNNFQYLQALYNYATSIGKTELSQTLDRNHSIIKKSIVNEMPEKIRIYGQFPDWIIIDKGNLGVCKSLKNDSNPNDKKANYMINPVLFNLSSGNYNLVESLLGRGYDIHPTLITHAVVSNIYIGNSDALSYLANNQKCREMIISNQDIELFLKNENDYIDKKKELISKLLATELSEELSNRAIKNKNKPKI